MLAHCMAYGIRSHTKGPLTNLVAPLNLFVTLGEIIRPRNLVNRSTTG